MPAWLSSQHDDSRAGLRQCYVLQGNARVGTRRQRGRDYRLDETKCVDQAGVAQALRNNMRPGRAPVGLPSRQTIAPLTITEPMPLAGSGECGKWRDATT